MVPRIAVYQLSHKFVDQREDIPESASQVVYYALAVGHHVGVMDCFSSLVEIPLEEFRTWLNGLPEGTGRTKLEGVLKWGEIEINRSHVKSLLPLLETNQPYTTSWMPILIQCLKGIVREPALYLMIRKIEK
jgi:hydrogenase-4 component J